MSRKKEIPAGIMICDEEVVIHEVQSGDLVIAPANGVRSPTTKTPGYEELVELVNTVAEKAKRHKGSWSMWYVLNFNTEEATTDALKVLRVKLSSMYNASANRLSSRSLTTFSIGFRIKWI